MCSVSIEKTFFSLFILSLRTINKKLIFEFFLSIFGCFFKLRRKTFESKDNTSKKRNKTEKCHKLAVKNDPRIFKPMFPFWERWTLLITTAEEAPSDKKLWRNSTGYI